MNPVRNSSNMVAVDMGKMPTYLADTITSFVREILANSLREIMQVKTQDWKVSVLRIGVPVAALICLGVIVIPRLIAAVKSFLNLHKRPIPQPIGLHRLRLGRMNLRRQNTESSRTSQSAPGLKANFSGPKLFVEDFANAFVKNSSSHQAGGFLDFMIKHSDTVSTLFSVVDDEKQKVLITHWDARQKIQALSVLMVCDAKDQKITQFKAKLVDEIIKGNDPHLLKIMKKAAQKNQEIWLSTEQFNNLMMIIPPIHVFLLLKECATCNPLFIRLVSFFERREKEFAGFSNCSVQNANQLNEFVENNLCDIDAQPEEPNSVPFSEHQHAINWMKRAKSQAWEKARTLFLASGTNRAQLKSQKLMEMLIPTLSLEEVSKQKIELEPRTQLPLFLEPEKYLEQQSNNYLYLCVQQNTSDGTDESITNLPYDLNSHTAIATLAVQQIEKLKSFDSKFLELLATHWGSKVELNDPPVIFYGGQSDGQKLAAFIVKIRNRAEKKVKEN